MARILGIPMSNIEREREGDATLGHAAVKRPYDCHLSNRILKELGLDISTHDFENWWTHELRRPGN